MLELLCWNPGNKVLIDINLPSFVLFLAPRKLLTEWPIVLAMPSCDIGMRTHCIELDGTVQCVELQISLHSMEASASAENKTVSEADYR